MSLVARHSLAALPPPQQIDAAWAKTCENWIWSTINIEDGAKNFEQMTAASLTVLGCDKVVVSQHSWDDNIDVSFTRKSCVGIAQCKRWRADIGPGPIREFSGANLIFKNRLWGKCRSDVKVISAFFSVSPLSAEAMECFNYGDIDYLVCGDNLKRLISENSVHIFLTMYSMGVAMQTEYGIMKLCENPLPPRYRPINVKKRKADNAEERTRKRRFINSDVQDQVQQTTITIKK